MRISNKRILKLALQAKKNGIQIIRQRTYDVDFEKVFKCTSIKELNKIKPCGACLLGAACYQLTGETGIGFKNIFNRSEEFINGVMCGFDGEKPTFKTKNKNKQRCFNQGFKFGQMALIELGVK